MRSEYISALPEPMREKIYGVLCVNMARLFPDWSWQQVLESAEIGMQGRVCDLEDVINLSEVLSE